MADYRERLKGDLVEQFRRKPYIEALMEVIGAEFQAVYNFYEQLHTERSLQTAVGKQLDGVGDIVAITRKEAARMVSMDSSISTEDDEIFRKYLTYKLLKNTGDCTYNSMVAALKLFWAGEDVQYREDPNYPATIILTVAGFSNIDNIQRLLEVPIIKAAGVGAVAEKRTDIEAPLHIGIVNQQTIHQTWKIDAFELEFVLVDEVDNLLLDEDEKILLDNEQIGG